MALEAPYPELSELLTLIGEAGKRLSEIDSTEGAAGNISVLVGWPIELRRIFPLCETIQLPATVPQLADQVVLATGSGRRLREIIQDPVANLGAVAIHPDGRTGTLHYAPGRVFARLTSELNSHLAVHGDQVIRTGTNFHTVLHAQPPYLTYLSHLPEYATKTTMSQRVMRWEPETIVQLPEGIYPIPFRVPGTPEQMEATVEALRAHRLVVWSKHGVVARSDTSVKRAADYVEYAETGARYEYMNLVNHERSTGLSVEEIRAICAAFNVQQSIF